MDKDNPQDDKTVLLDHHGQPPAAGGLTDAVAPPRIEHLHERMVFAARQPLSQAFNVSLNPLVAAASGLLSQIVRIKHAPDREALPMLKRELTWGLEQFEARAVQGGIENSQLVAARYVLCTAIDEAVVTSAWGEKGDWSQMSLLSTFHNETFGGEKVFQLLDRLSKNPVKHLSMLELLYLCLSLGFEGKYRVQARGGLELEGIRDALYRLIRQTRGDVACEFLPRWEGTDAERRRPVRTVPARVVVGFALVCLGVMYSSFAWVLNEHRESVLQSYQQLAPDTAQPQPQQDV